MRAAQVRGKRVHGMLGNWKKKDGLLQSLPGASVHAILLERKGVLQA